MSTYSKLYWLTRLDSIHALFLTFAIVLAVAGIAVIIYAVMSLGFDDNHHGVELTKRRNERKKITSKLWMAFVGSALFGILTTFIPTKNEAIFIVAGGKTIDWVQQDSSMNKIPSQTTLIISDFLEKQIREIESAGGKN